MRDPVTDSLIAEAIDVPIEDPQASLVPIEEEFPANGFSTFDQTPYDADGNPVWE